MPLIDCKIHLELNWTKNSVMSSVAPPTTFQITSTNLYVPIVTLPSNTCMFFVMAIEMVILIKLKGTVTENNFFQE